MKRAIFKQLKHLAISLTVIYFAVVGIQILQIYMVVNNLEIAGKPNKISLEDFGIKEFGDTYTGDPIDISATINSISSENQKVNVKIIDIVGEEEYLIKERTISLKPFGSKDIEERYYLNKYGDHTIEIEVEVDEQRITESKKLKVKSFRKDTHFAATYFHFNVQFIAGDKQVEENILNNSIRPLIEFYYKNPEYKFSFEIQGYGIEIIAERYPETLKYMKKMVNRGQMELIVTHYSDQYFLAYPLVDFEKSIDLSDEVLKDNGLRKSNVFGTQEWQWSPYLPELMDKRGYDIFIGRDKMFRHYTSLSDNYWHYEETNLFTTEWDDKKVYLALDRGGRIEDLEKTPENTMIYDWLHRGDGELVNTYGSNSDFKFNEGRQRHFEETLEEYKEEGYKFVTISELIYAAKDKGFEEKELDPIPDSAQGSNVYVWSGEHRSTRERDSYINTLRYKARTMLLATETIIEFADSCGLRVSEDREIIEDLWKDLIMAQVTDATGWEPRQVEVNYGIELTKNVTDECEEIYSVILNELGLSNERLLIDTKQDDVIEEEDYLISEYEIVDCPVPFDLNYIEYETECYK